MRAKGFTAFRISNASLQLAIKTGTILGLSPVTTIIYVYFCCENKNTQGLFYFRGSFQKFHSKHKR